MSLFFTFLFLNIFSLSKCKREHIPVLVWTSPDFQIERNADHFALDKIDSESLEFFFSELLREKKPAIVVFLEEDLDAGDFDWKNEDGNNFFPFLTEQTVASKLRHFREVEAPNRILAGLLEKGYEGKNLNLDGDFVVNEGDLILMEFGKIDEGRPETLKSHDGTMGKISEQLTGSGKSWICIYTARKCKIPGSSSPDKKLSSWYAAEEFVKRPVRALSLYHDEHTGFALLTKGSIELRLPSLNNVSFKPLDNYLRASGTSFRKKVNFTIWFLNYKLTFYVNQENSEWIIKEAEIMNDNGDTLNLIQNPDAKKRCTEMVEFLSEDDSKIKVTLPKYKIKCEGVSGAIWLLLKFSTAVTRNSRKNEELNPELHFLKLSQQQSCEKPYAVQMTALFILFLVVFSILIWNSILQSYDFSAESKVPSDKILAIKFDTMSF